MNPRGIGSLTSSSLVWTYIRILISVDRENLYQIFTPAPPSLPSQPITNFLLTEREGRTEEYWPEVVAVRTERSEVRTKTTEGQYSPVRLELAR